jgi:dihydrofolate reductase
MNNKNSVFIATSLDGFIADKNGGIDWLHSMPNPDNIDMGYAAFMNEIDALVMGRTTFETVLQFDMDWPYKKPVFVLSTTLTQLPKSLDEKAFLVNGSVTDILQEINGKGYTRLYIDGGTTIRSFLKEDRIDEIILTTIPILLGGGAPLFGDLPHQQKFELIETNTFLNHVVQRHYRRKK